MAERIKHKFLEEERLVDIVVGPDAYGKVIKLILIKVLGILLIITLMGLVLLNKQE